MKLGVTRRRVRSLAVVAVTVLVAGLAPNLAQAQTPGGGARPTDPACAGVPTTPFTDVGAEGSSVERAVACVYEYGVTVGTTDITFSPGVTVNRGQMASFVYRTLDLVLDLDGIGDDADTFTDVVGTPLEQTTDILQELGVISGYGDGTYRPSIPISREQVARVVAVALEAAGVELPTDPSSPFTDTTTSVFRTWIDQLAALGILSGTTATTFNPGAGLTRGQMALILARSLAQLVDDDLLEPIDDTPPPTSTTTTTEPLPTTTTTTEPPADTTAPALVSSNPDDGEVDVPVGIDPTATFDEPLDPDSTAWLLCDGAALDGEVTVEDATITFDPAARLAPVAVCALTFEAVDTAGNTTVAGIGFTTEEDVTGPVLTTSTPADGDTGVRVSAEPAATFDEPLGEGSTASVVCGGVALEGTVTGDGTTLQVNPTGAMPYLTSCTALFIALDTDGNRTVTGIGFRTEADTYAPVAQSTTPPLLSGPVPLDTAFSATFDEPLADNPTVDMTCDDTTIEGTTAVEGATVTFTPDEDLPDAANCSVTLTVTDRAGNPTNVSTAFPTVDITPPVRTGTVPAPGAVDVGVGTTPSATYDEPLGDASTATLTCDGSPVVGTSDVAGATLQFVPADDLPSSAECTATFVAVDLAENDDLPTTLDFTVADVEGPRVLSSVPADTAVGVALDTTTVTVQFDEPLATAFTATLTCDGSLVATETAVDDASLTLTLAGTLPGGVGCTVTFSVADLGANPTDGGIGFTTAVPLTMVTSNPWPRQADVRTSGVVLGAVFDGPLDPDRSTVSITCADADVPGEVVVIGGEGDGSEILFTPEGDLPAASDCTMTLSVFSATGMALAPITITFSTTADATPPALVGTDADWNSTRYVTLDFSEPLDPDEAVDTANYLLSEGGDLRSPIEALLVEPDRVRLDFGSSLDCGDFNVNLDYTAVDLAGNRTVATTRLYGPC